MTSSGLEEPFINFERKSTHWCPAPHGIWKNWWRYWAKRPLGFFCVFFAVSFYTIF